MHHSFEQQSCGGSSLRPFGSFARLRSVGSHAHLPSCGPPEHLYISVFHLCTQPENSENAFRAMNPLLLILLLAILASAAAIQCYSGSALQVIECPSMNCIKQTVGFDTVCPHTGHFAFSFLPFFLLSLVPPLFIQCPAASCPAARPIKGEGEGEE